MDELISKLRSSQRTSPGDTQRGVGEGDVSPAEHVTKFVRRPEEEESEGVAEEVVASQHETGGPGFKLDFDYLARHREPGSAHIEDVLRMPGYKMESPLCVFVKSTDVFGDGLARWELCDETGVVYGTSAVSMDRVTVGDIVCLENCSLWKFEENHLNVVDENVKRVVGMP